MSAQSPNKEAIRRLRRDLARVKGVLKYPFHNQSHRRLLESQRDKLKEQLAELRAGKGAA